MAFEFTSWLHRQHGVVQVVCVLMLLYVFLLGISMLGEAFKTAGKEQAATIIENSTNNPLTALFIGLLVTSLVQSSSTTTSLTVSLVAAGTLSIEHAIPIVMGANLGTTVTNTIVSLGHITRKDEFERAFTAATVHDLFNLLTILLLFPLELLFGILEQLSRLSVQFIAGGAGAEFDSPLKWVLDPVVKGVKHFLLEGLQYGKLAAGVILLLLACGFIFFALYWITRCLKTILQDRVESTIDKVLRKSGYLNILIGIIVTAIVQSSSITTSVLVPLVAAGVIEIRRAYPITLGANIGTTLTALIASSATGAIAGLQIALVHLFFNLAGTVIFYVIPVFRDVPVRCAIHVAQVVARRRSLAVVFLIMLFYVIPAVFLLIDWLLFH